jgi:hypothetical protein
MGLQKKARESLEPLRTHIAHVSAAHAVDGIIEGLPISERLFMVQVDTFVELEARFTGVVDGLQSVEQVTMTYPDFDDTRALPAIVSEWSKGTPSVYRVGALGPYLILGASGHNSVALRRYPDYAQQFLDEFNYGHEIGPAKPI